MSTKKAKARLLIKKLLEDSGWRLLDDDNGKANVDVEGNTSVIDLKVNESGETFEKEGRGFMDYLLLDKQGRPLIVLEAKAEDKDPHIGKEQA